MTENIKFKYLYRDGGNYKKYSSVIFKNPKASSVEIIRSRLEKAFWNSSLFIAHQVIIPELFFEDFPNDDDISFHEFDDVEVTIEEVSDSLNRTIDDFVIYVETESIKGWSVFTPRKRLSLL